MTANDTQPANDTLMRVPAITERLGVSRSYFWAGVKSGKFPPGIKLSSRVTVWKRSDIDGLIAKLGK
jgi:prophage regulatory protein